MLREMEVKYYSTACGLHNRHISDRSISSAIRLSPAEHLNPVSHITITRHQILHIQSTPSSLSVLSAIAVPGRVLERDRYYVRRYRQGIRVLANFDRMLAVLFSSPNSALTVRSTEHGWRQQYKPGWMLCDSLGQWSARKSADLYSTFGRYGVPGREDLAQTLVEPPQSNLHESHIVSSDVFSVAAPYPSTGPVAECDSSIYDQLQTAEERLGPASWRVLGLTPASYATPVAHFRDQHC
jgi:hypothetical protein